MAVLVAYFDKSGDVDQPLVAVAGFLATDFKWDCIETEWKKTMLEFGVQDFHMTNFFKNGNGFPRKDWPAKRKDEFMRRLASILYDYTQQPVGHAVTRNAVSEANLGTSKKYFGNQYQFACFLCIQNCIEWAKEAEALRERVDFVFDNDGSFYTPVATAYAVGSKNAETVKKWKIGNFAFSDRQCSAGIQAADMLAYLLLEYHRRHLANRRAHPHRYLVWLLRRPIHDRGMLIDRKEQVEAWGKILEKNFGNPPRGFLKGFNPKRKGGRK